MKNQILFLCLAVCLFCLLSGSRAEDSIFQGDYIEKLSLPIMFSAEWNNDKKQINVTVTNVSDTSLRFNQMSLNNPQIIFDAILPPTKTDRGLKSKGGIVYPGMPATELLSKMRNLSVEQFSETMVNVMPNENIVVSISLVDSYENILKRLPQDIEKEWQIKIRAEFFNLIVPVETIADNNSTYPKKLKIFSTSWMRTN